MKEQKTNNGKNGGLLKGDSHDNGGIKVVITDDNRPVEVEGGEVIINKHAAKKHWKTLSKINQSAGNGVPITEPQFKAGGNLENQIIYYKQLISDDRKRLKNSSGGESENILQNISYNTKMLNRVKKQSKTHIKKLTNGGDVYDSQLKAGGGVGEDGIVDLFDDYDNIPPKIQKILDKYSKAFEDGDYKGLAKALKEVEAKGYTFEYYLDGQAYGLRPKNVPLNKLQGFEDEEEDVEENAFKTGGKIIEFNPNHVPPSDVIQYALKIKNNHPEIWKLGGNIFGNEAFENIYRAYKRGNWLDSEEWMYIKWRSYVARHKKDFRIEGVIAMLKWCDKVEKGWSYMKQLIESEIKKKANKSGWKTKKNIRMSEGGNTEQYKTIAFFTNKKFKIFDGKKTFSEIKKSFGITPLKLDTIKLKTKDLTNSELFIKWSENELLNKYNEVLYPSNLYFSIIKEGENNIVKNAFWENELTGEKYEYDAENIAWVKDIRFDNGGNVEDLISKGIVELKMFDTTPEHAKEYGLQSFNPLYVQTFCISEPKRLKGLGKKVLAYIEKYAIENEHDVVFGHITQKAKFSKDNRQTFYSDVEMIKNWLHSKGYSINEENNDFHKVINSQKNPDIRFEGGGEVITYRNKYNKKYGYDLDESHDLEQISKDTGVSLKGLQEIYNKGIGAYKTNPESVRSNVTSKEQWAMGRVYSSVMGGKASKVDSNELKMEKGDLIESTFEFKKWQKENMPINGVTDFELKDGTSISVDWINLIILISKKLRGLDYVENKEKYRNTKYNSFLNRVKKLALGEVSFEISNNKQHLIEHSKFVDRKTEIVDTNKLKMEDGGEIKQNNLSRTSSENLKIELSNLLKEGRTSEANDIARELKSRGQSQSNVSHGMGFNDFMKKTVTKKEVVPEIVFETMDLGIKLINEDYYSKIIEIPELAPYIKDIKTLNLGKKGWKFQFGSSREWAGLCSAQSTSNGQLDKRNVYVSIQFVKGDDNWKQEVQNTIYHELAHAIIFEIFLFGNKMKQLDDIDPSYNTTQGHGMLFTKVCNALGSGKHDCGRYYTNLKAGDMFKKRRYVCRFCGNKQFGESENFATKCSKCNKPVIIESNVI